MFGEHQPSYLYRMTKVAIVDDHTIFCDSLSSLINDFDGFEVCWVAHDGKEAINKLEYEKTKPDILLLDIIMKTMSGPDVAKWLHERHSTVHVLALTMEEDDDTVIKMLQYGVKGYLLKNISADELQNALNQVVKFGYYYTPIVTSNIQKKTEKKNHSTPDLTEREKELLGYVCTDMSYAEIAKKMFLSESTIDTHRAKLFEKFEVKNRVGLMLKAVQLGLVKL
jgi:two-component system, NarL family, invasion response regulator UvrY